MSPSKVSLHVDGYGGATGASEQGEQGQRPHPQLLGRSSSAPPKVCRCDRLAVMIINTRLFLLCTKLTKLVDFYDVTGVVVVSLLLS